MVKLLAQAVLHRQRYVSKGAVETLQEVCQTEDAASTLLVSWRNEPELQALWPPSLRMMLLQTESGFDALQDSGRLACDFCLRELCRYRSTATVSSFLGTPVSSAIHSLAPMWLSKNCFLKRLSNAQCHKRLFSTFRAWEHSGLSLVGTLSEPRASCFCRLLVEVDSHTLLRASLSIGGLSLGSLNA